MSRLTDLLGELRRQNPQLGADLEAEIDSLAKQRKFGLVFERHLPETVELPGLKPRVGSKVRVLPTRGSKAKRDPRLWMVERFTGSRENQLAQLMTLSSDGSERAEVAVADLVVVAEFADPIYPGLIETGRVGYGGSKPYNLVIEGENYHALEMLTYTNRHNVDAIYIDPPYNTGAKDWKYSNDYVDGSDAYRHSKWLAFMERRLRIAKELLNPDDSVLIVTIDEKEYLRLGLLLEQLYPEAAIQMVTIVINPNGVARGAELSRVEEYAFFCFFGKAAPAMVLDPLLDQGSRPPDHVRWERLMRGGSNSRRIDRPNLFYPIYIDETQRRIVDVGEPLPLDLPVSTVPDRDGLRTLWPIRASGEEANWRASPEYLRELLERGFAKLGSYNRKSDWWTVLYLGKAQIRRIKEGHLVVAGTAPDGAKIVEMGELGMRRTPKTVWNRPRHSAGEHGSRMLRTLLPQRSFPFPKSLYAVEDALRIAVQDKPDAVILDFFAGSGTTAHAVMRLNRQDSGHRRCISVTNNEVSADEQSELTSSGLRAGDPEWEALGICDYITKPRIEAAITGNTPDGASIKGEYRFTDEFPMSEGFEENAAFFTLTYESPLAVKHNRAFRQIAPMLWMRAGASGRIIETLGERGWDIAETYGVLENFDRSSEFLEALSAADTVRIVFLVTDDDAAYQMVSRNLPSSVAPVRLYSSYLLNFEINRGRY